LTSGLRYVLIVTSREWLELRRSPLVIGTLTLMPLALVALPLCVLLLLAAGVTPEQVRALHNISPKFAGMQTAQDLELGVLNQFLVAFLLLPVILPLSIATTSIVAEKQTRSLEPMLATPVPSAALLVGKCVSAVLPAVGATWLAYVLFLVGAETVGGATIARALTTPVWLATMLVLVPLFCCLVVTIGLAISARVRDIRAAQNLTSLLILPLNGSFIAQALGAIELGLRSVFSEGLLVLCACAFAMAIAIRLFDRDAIMGRWG
jgi:ABC-2 type transport system permease protein